MNQEIKAQWVAALRSGEYKQGTGELRTHHEDGTESFCCLGVLCDLAVKAHAIPEPTYRGFLEAPGEGSYTYREFPEAPGEGNYNYDDPSDEAKFGELPETVMAWAEIGSPMVTEIEPRSEGNFGYPNLAGANDDGMSFEAIASAIEEWL